MIALCVVRTQSAALTPHLSRLGILLAWTMSIFDDLRNQLFAASPRPVTNASDRFLVKTGVFHDEMNMSRWNIWLVA